MNKTLRQPRKDAKTISIVLSAEDQDYISRLMKEFGLIKTTDCLRLALREAIKRNDSRQAA